MPLPQGEHMPQAPQIEKQPPSGLLACELERAECRECGREPSGPHSKFDSFTLAS